MGGPSMSIPQTSVNPCSVPVAKSNDRAPCAPKGSTSVGRRHMWIECFGSTLIGKEVARKLEERVFQKHGGATRDVDSKLYFEGGGKVMEEFGPSLKKAESIFQSLSDLHELCGFKPFKPSEPAVMRMTLGYMMGKGEKWYKTMLLSVWEEFSTDAEKLAVLGHDGVLRPPADGWDTDCCKSYKVRDPVPVPNGFPGLPYIFSGGSWYKLFRGLWRFGARKRLRLLESYRSSVKNDAPEPGESFKTEKAMEFHHGLGTLKDTLPLYTDLKEAKPFRYTVRRVKGPRVDHLLPSLQKNVRETVGEERNAWRRACAARIRLLRQRRAAAIAQSRFVNMEDLIVECRRTVREVYGRAGKWSKRRRLETPSQSSHLAYGEEDGWVDLTRKAGGGTALLGYEKRDNILVEVSLPTESDEHWGEEDFVKVKIPLPHDRTFEMKIVKDERLYARAVQLSEPLKIRTITLGPDLPYYMVKYAQKLMWGPLMDHPTFLLCGRPVQEDPFSDPQEADLIDTVFKDAHWLCSGDYSAATDNLHPTIMRACVDEICKTLLIPDAYKALMEKCLFQHRISAPGWVDHEGILHDGPIFDQVWGQVMGSPISFPLLCLVNGAMNRLVLEIDQSRSLLLHQCPLLINGDDSAYGLDIRHNHHIWCRITSMAGLVPSPGKNSISRRFLSINSEHWTRKSPGGGFQRLYPIRLDMCRNFAKNASRTRGQLKSLMTYTAEYSYCVEQHIERLVLGQSPDVALRLFRMFLKENKEWLKVPHIVNWFLPSWLNGLGLPLRLMDKSLTKVTTEQLDLCNYLLKSKPGTAEFQRIMLRDPKTAGHISDNLDKMLKPLEGSWRDARACKIKKKIKCKKTEKNIKAGDPFWVPLDKLQKDLIAYAWLAKRQPQKPKEDNRPQNKFTV